MATTIAIMATATGIAEEVTALTMTAGMETPAASTSPAPAGHIMAVLHQEGARQDLQ